MKINTTMNQYAHESFLETLNSLFSVARQRKPELRLIESMRRSAQQDEHIAIRFTRSVMPY